MAYLARPSLLGPTPIQPVLAARGGGGVFTGSLATGPPSPIYAKHTTINGSRPGFIVVVIIAGLIFFAILGGGYWWYRRRRQRLASGVSKRYNFGRGGIGGQRKSMSGGPASSNPASAGKWTTLEDQDDEDAFAMPLAYSTNPSVMDLNSDDNDRSAQDYAYPRKWNPVYAASGDSINFTRSSGNIDEQRSRT